MNNYFLLILYIQIVLHNAIHQVAFNDNTKQLIFQLLDIFYYIILDHGVILNMV